jgi:hypothetical protein
MPTKRQPSRKRVPQKRTPRKRKPRSPAGAPLYPRTSLFYKPTAAEVAEIVRRGDQFKQQEREETAFQARVRTGISEQLG